MAHYLIVDGYNVIHQAAEMAHRPVGELENEREWLLHHLADYSGYRGLTSFLVFDAYSQEDIKTRSEIRNKVTVVFTGKDITADSYIERKVYDILGDTREKRRRNRNQVEVVTSDEAVQQMALGTGAVRMSSRELLTDMAEYRKKLKVAKKQAPQTAYNRMSDHVAGDVRKTLEALRRADDKKKQQ